MPPRDYGNLRWILAGFALLVVIVTFALTLYSVLTTNVDSGLADIKFNELTSESITNRIDFSRSLFEIALLVTAGVWALVIAKHDEIGIRFADRQEVIMLVCASLLLLASLVDHALYLNYISRIYFWGGKLFDQANPTMPDAFDKNINNFYQYQIAHLVSGAFIAVLTLFSAHNLKEKP